MRSLAWTPVLLALALTGCPDKDTGETDPGTDTEGTEDPDTMDPDTDTMDPDTEPDTEPPGPQAGDVVFFEGFETDGTVLPDGWVAETGEGADAAVVWKLCAVGTDCDGNSGANLALADGDYYAAIDADGDGTSGVTYQGTLTSAAIDLSEYSDFSIQMNLDQWYRDLGDSDSGSIEVSSDAGATWNIVQDYPAISEENNSTANGPCPSIYDLSEYAGETIQLRFNYASAWDWWFMVDNIELVLADEAPTLPTPDAWTCPAEVCDDAIDNDLDLFADCADADCAEDALCADVCLAEALTLPATGQGMTPTDMASNLDWSTGTDCTSGSGPELVVSVDAVAGDVITASELSSAFDAVVRISDGCSAGSTCLASVDIGDTASYTVEADGTYYVIIEAWGAGEVDDFDYVIGLNPAEAEDCTTEGDEDLDGFADCADSECVDEAACQEVCDSGMDEDVDGLTDCDDIEDCFTDAACPYECPVSEDVVFTDGVFTATGDFADLDADLPYADGEGCVNSQGVSTIWQMTVPAGQQLVVSEAQDSFEDSAIHILDDCMPSMACADSGDEPSEARVAAGDADRTVYVAMQAWSAFNTSGTWTVTATLVNDEDCTTDVDEDMDGDIACDDSDCAMDEACFELDCTDGVSGDDDELVDCMDPDCDDSVDCVEMDCADGIDNDMDGDMDCMDTQCIGTAACPEVDCDDGMDNDDDNAVDCLDSDCDDAPICFECPDADLFPLTISGDDWLADNPDVGAGFTSSGGCRSEGNGDFFLAIEAEAGQIFEAVDNDSADMYINITEGEGMCNSAQTDNTCVFADDDESGAGTGIDNYRFVFPNDGVYYVYVTTFTSSDNRAYDITFDVVDPELCDTTVDEDGDGAISCDDSDCFDDIDNCPLECPAESVAGDFPIQLVGDAWADENRDSVDFVEENGCEGGSSGGGADFIVAVDMQIGDTISTVENSGGVDFIANVTLGSCFPDDVANTCLYSADDGPDGGYSYTAVEAGIHYLQISSWSNTENDAYDMTIDFTPAAP